jgi:hypothetical protein
MSLGPDTTANTAVVGGNQVSTASPLTAPWRPLGGEVQRHRVRRGTRRAKAGACARSRCAKSPRSMVLRRAGGNQVSTPGSATRSQPWKPGFHGARRSAVLAFEAKTSAVGRVGGNQVSTALAMTALRQCDSGNFQPCPVPMRRQAAPGEVTSAVWPSTPQTHRRSGGNQVSMLTRPSSSQTWKPGFHGRCRTRLMRLDASARTTCRNFGGNQVSTPQEVQHG